jgi:hypothetical protein
VPPQSAASRSGDDPAGGLRSALFIRTVLDTNGVRP